MAWTYRPAREEERRVLVVQDAEAFGGATDPASVERALARTRLEEVRVLEEGGRHVGLLVARVNRVFWGGRPVPASQVSGLSVGAAYRGRGAGGELVRSYLAEAHDRGLAISTLYPATVHLYRRAGYEYAGTWTLYEAAARHLPAEWPEGWRAVPVPTDDPAPFQERFQRLAPTRNGQVERDADWWRAHILADQGHGPPQAYLLDGPDGPDGWAVLKAAADPTPALKGVRVRVLDWGAASAGGWRALLALAAGFSSLDAVVNWNGPDPEPLALLLREQDLRQVRQERFMLRVVDVAAAFSARGYPEGVHGQLTIEVADEACPWVAGTWSLEVADGEGKASRVGARARARTDARGLAALFAGYLDPGALAELGLVHGLDPADLAFLRAVHAGPPPWSPDYY